MHSPSEGIPEMSCRNHLKQVSSLILETLQLNSYLQLITALYDLVFGLMRETRLSEWAVVDIS